VKNKKERLCEEIPVKNKMILTRPARLKSFRGAIPASKDDEASCYWDCFSFTTFIFTFEKLRKGATFSLRKIKKHPPTADAKCILY